MRDLCLPKWKLSLLASWLTGWFLHLKAFTILTASHSCSRAISSRKIVPFGFCHPRKRLPSLTINDKICTKDLLPNLIKLSSGLGRGISALLYFAGGGKRKIVILTIDHSFLCQLRVVTSRLIRRSNAFSIVTTFFHTPFYVLAEKCDAL